MTELSFQLLLHGCAMPTVPNSLFTGTYGIRNGVVNHGGAASQLKLMKQEDFIAS